jgi:ankyrin repeat protein
MDDSALAHAGLRLHDAQSCVAREYGFASWQELRTFVSLSQPDNGHLLHEWLDLVYGKDQDRARPRVAVRILANMAPQRAAALGRRPVDHAVIACATGDVAWLRTWIAADPARANQRLEWTCPSCGVTIARPPLVAVALSSLLQLPDYADGLRAAATLLLGAGADPNGRWDHSGMSLSALYGAAGVNHDPALTRMLLEAGADPNDGESLYHAMETRDLTCARLLLEAGARVPGSNALRHQLDTDNLEGLRLLLAHGADPNDAGPMSPLVWAIRRGRSRAHVEALLAAGADPHAGVHGISPYRLACAFGLTEVAEAIAAAGAGEPLSPTEQFIAACARADRAAAERLLQQYPDLIARLSPMELSQLPNLAALGRLDSVRVMVELGWPIAARGGDILGSALNQAVFRGDSVMTRYLLAHGASWTERHRYNDNVRGTLSWASRNHDPEEGDWLGCAKALVEYGMPRDLAGGEYSEEVKEFLGGQ